MLKLTSLGDNNYQIGLKFRTQIRQIEDVLSATLSGVFIPFDDFVKIQFLTILEREDTKRIKHIIKD